MSEIHSSFCILNWFPFVIIVICLCNYWSNFTVCNRPNIEILQYMKSTSICFLSLNGKNLWLAWSKTVMGLTVNTNSLNSRDHTWLLKSNQRSSGINWTIIQRILKVANIHTLVGKLDWLGKGAPWLYKIMLHFYIVYTSLHLRILYPTKRLVIHIFSGCDCSTNIAMSKQRKTSFFSKLS